MERAFDREMADLIRGFTGDLGKVVRELLAKNRKLTGENARLKAKLQGVKDQVADVEETVPDSDEIAARGSQHQAVNEDIRESVERGIENAAPIKTSRGLSMLLNALRNPPDDPLPEFPDEPRRVEA